MLVRGVILDLDGLLIDSERWSWQAHNATLSQLGAAPLTLDEVQQLIGLASADEWRMLLRLRPLQVEQEVYATLCRTMFRTMREQLLAPLPGVTSLLAEVARRRLRLALASNSSLPSITAALQALGIREAFDAVCSGEETPLAKPAPDVYQLALSRLGLQPQEAIAVEDSLHGVAAARAAGLFCIAVPGELTSMQDFSLASLRLTNLNEVTAWLRTQPEGRADT